MCDFPAITRFGFRSLCDKGIKYRSVPFHFGWRVFPCCPWGKRLLNCVWVRLLPMRPKDHMQKRSYLTHSPCYPWEERQNLEGMGEVAAHGAKRLHTREDNIMPVVNEWIPWPVYMVVWYICDKLSYIRFYGFGIILLVLIDYSIWFHGIILRNFVFHHIIILVTLLLKMILQDSVRNFSN